MEPSILASNSSFVLEKFSLKLKIFLYTAFRFVSFEQFLQTIAYFSCAAWNSSPRRSSRYWQVFVLFDPENNLLRRAGFSTSQPHCKQIFSGAATRTKHFVGVFLVHESSERRLDYTDVEDRREHYMQKGLIQRIHLKLRIHILGFLNRLAIGYNGTS